MEDQTTSTTVDADCDIDNTLSDLMKRAVMLQRLAKLHATYLAHSSSNGGGGGIPSSSGLSTTASRMFSFSAPEPFQGASFNPAAWYPFLPFPVTSPQSFVWPHPAVPQVLLTSNTATLLVKTTRTERNPTIDSRENEDIVEQHGDRYESDQSGESDVVHLLGEQEADQFREPEFDLRLKDETAWKLPELQPKFDRTRVEGHSN